ncbi:MAG TPA: glycerophosphodiester phosphodiesterase family protein [Puia sp.]|nr:glycerophosphodiester phosphodiesterase family protein [Puia sp.]
MKHQHLLLLILPVIFFSCNKNTITAPDKNPDTNLVNTIHLSDTVMKNMEGIYTLTDGSGNLGMEFVCKVSKSKVSFFSNTDGIYMILQYGFRPNDSSIQFAGFWRYSESATEGLINLSIKTMNGLSDLILKGLTKQLRLSGSFSGDNNSQQAITLQFVRPFSQYALDHEFMIFAHHGVQTTANPPYTENSLNGAIHAGDYGVNGLEFDVQLTSDHVPICAHDASINTRVTEKGPLTGDYIQYSFAFLDSFVTLTDGEKIPSVEQVLNAFVDSTNLKYMWLDIKGDPDIFKYLEPVVRNAYARAAAAHRNVEIISDLTSDKVISEYHSCPSYASLPTICEVSLDDVIQNHSQYWGPRYSLGLLLDDVAKAHSMGIKVLSWTLNDKNLISDYLLNGKFDGFITDYPAYVVYDFYTFF